MERDKEHLLPLDGTKSCLEETYSKDEENVLVRDRSFGYKLKNRTRYWNICLTIGLLFLYIPATLLFVASTTKSRNEAHNLLPDLATAAKHSVVQRFPPGFRSSPFAGPPSEELDAAWHGLFEQNNIRVELEDLQAVGLESLPLQQGGYIAQPSVFHELHCLKKIRHWVFKDYYVYPTNPSEAELKEWEAHIHHCIERIRLAVMCRGDTALATFNWLKDGNTYVPTVKDSALHQCVSWDDIVSWTEERSVNLTEPGLLVPRIDTHE